MIRFWIIVIALTVLVLIFFRRYLFTLKDQALQKQVFEQDHKRKVREEKMAEIEDEPRHDMKRTTPKARPTKEINNAYRKADMAFAKGDFEEAEKVFIKVLALDDAHADANLKLGLVYLQKGESAKAEFFFNKLLETKKDPLFFSNLALALYQQKRLPEAAEAYEQAINLDQRKESRFVSLAHVYRELGNEEKALTNMERATQLAPRNTEYLFVLVDGYVMQGNEGKALQALERILMIEPYNEKAKARQQEIIQKQQGIVPHTIVAGTKEEKVADFAETETEKPIEKQVPKKTVEQQALPL